MLAKVFSGAVLGVEAYPIAVEVDLADGVPNYALVGLPDAAIQEARERVRAALRNSGYAFPVSRITINLAPADVRKEGPLYDLPIALGLLVASGQLQTALLVGCLVVGELALDGQVRPVRGVLSLALAARAAGLQTVLVPTANAKEAALVAGVRVYAIDSLAQAAAVLSAPHAYLPVEAATEACPDAHTPEGADLAEVRGQALARRAMELAAAGGHNLVLVGPPGSGKTMLARRLPGILPPLGEAEALELTQLYSVAGLLPERGSLVTTRPFRAPHHTVSGAALIGGGPHPRPGEVSLASHGVLFLDELAEFRRDVLEHLRQPLEEGRVTIARTLAVVTFPARTTLVAALNPCPCGYRGDTSRACSCTDGQADRYWSRLSGPLLDRIDLQVAVRRLGEDELLSDGQGESSGAVRARVIAARARQAARFGDGARATPGRRNGGRSTPPRGSSDSPLHGATLGPAGTLAAPTGLVFCNAQMTAAQLRRYCVLDAEGTALMRAAIANLGLSGRAFDKILKIARTIADLAGCASIEAMHVAEAIQFRTFERRPAA